MGEVEEGSVSNIRKEGAPRPTFLIISHQEHSRKKPQGRVVQEEFGDPGIKGKPKHFCQSPRKGKLSKRGGPLRSRGKEGGGGANLIYFLGSFVLSLGGKRHFRGGSNLDMVIELEIKKLISSTGKTRGWGSTTKSRPPRWGEGKPKFYVSWRLPERWIEREFVRDRDLVSERVKEGGNFYESRVLREVSIKNLSLKDGYKS